MKRSNNDCGIKLARPVLRDWHWIILNWFWPWFLNHFYFFSKNHNCNIKLFTFNSEPKKQFSVYIVVSICSCWNDSFKCFKGSSLISGRVRICLSPLQSFSTCFLIILVLLISRVKQIILCSSVKKVHENCSNMP